MQLTRFVRTLGLFLVLGAFDSMLGCGSKSQQVALDAEDENGMLVAETRNPQVQQTTEGIGEGEFGRPARSQVPLTNSRGIIL